MKYIFNIVLFEILLGFFLGFFLMTNIQHQSVLRLCSQSLHGTADQCNQTCGILYTLLFEQIQLEGRVSTRQCPIRPFVFTGDICALPIQFGQESSSQS